ncbi:hypothetical protein MRB53_011569 [Persea americana]|uniref:Uncharacterized protein n=1 Tax=Persea americana TaxID=3435 RepID=A0ACC2LUZ8_PERAE|nr:hypothetical protein MRB53_011569 [Persea americana]
MDSRSQSLMSAILLLHLFFTISIDALNVGIQSNNSSVKNECSRKCESEFCKVPPFLRYGKYCGLLYSGCPGEKPCDGLDLCCQAHDACVEAKNNGYLSQECSQGLLNCMTDVKNSGRPSFKGSKCSVGEVVDVITVVMEAALVAGRVLHKP